jgi:DNA-binding MarR family transcriptional regulator
MSQDATPPRGAWSDSLPFAIWRTERAVSRIVDQNLRELPVTTTQLGCCVTIAENGPTSAAEIARRFRVSPQSIVAAFAKLEEGGWVRRLPHPSHRRIVLFELTPAGVELVARGRRGMGAASVQVAAGLDPDEQVILAALLQKVVVASGGADLPGSAWPLGIPPVDR